MNKKATLSPGMRTYDQGEVTIDLAPPIYQDLQDRSANLSEFTQRLIHLIAEVEHNRQQYNINPYAEKFNRGIYILGKDESELGVFPNSNLVLKCSEGRWNAENPRRQFLRSLELAWEFKARLTEPEQALLQICPVYLHFQTRAKRTLFKRVLVMPHIEGTPLGKIETGFSAEFCQTFKIPDTKEILRKFRFTLHRLFDPDQKRQLLKIQSAYLFQRLSQKGIRIFSLNQKNILATSKPNKTHTQYVIIDPIADYYLPISPIYNLLTAQLCRWG
ncbi:MAG: hypothetical protein SFW36_04955 [Leptolyngbyaceae cyanobacterium bins.59]|nr:hypothetical protein [Leptolyngbyaceae cyanobacterium bins.59]